MKHYIFASICCLLLMAWVPSHAGFGEEPMLRFLLICLILAGNLALHLLIDQIREKFGLPPRTICLFSAVFCLVLSFAGLSHWTPFPRLYLNLYPYFLAFGAPLTYSYLRPWSDSPQV